MASTGALRQALQQTFVIPIEEENSSTIPGAENINKENDDDDDGFSTFNEFADDDEIKKDAETKKIEELTEDDVDAEFANF